MLRVVFLLSRVQGGRFAAIALSAVLLAACAADPGSPVYPAYPDYPTASKPDPAALAVIHSDAELREAHRQASRTSSLRTAEIGYFLDLQMARLQGLAGGGAAIERRGDRILIGVPGQGAFTTGSAHLEPVAVALLDSVADVLVEYPQSLIAIGGHSDSMGNEAYNQSLSERRALAVGQHLMRHGVSRHRIVGRGFGSSQPIGDNQTESGRVANRRIEILLWPLVAEPGEHVGGNLASE